MSAQRSLAATVQVPTALTDSTVGQFPTFSEVTRSEEEYGIIASIIGTKGKRSIHARAQGVLTKSGNDAAVVDLASDVLHHLGIPRKVLTGRTPFEKRS